MKPVKFIIRTNLQIMLGILKNENIVAKNSSRILKWFLWLQNFDFEIVYKPGYLNCVAGMLTSEELQENPNLNMFSFGASNSTHKNSKLCIFRGPLLEEEREIFLNFSTKKRGR